MKEGAEPLTAEAVREFCTGQLAHKIRATSRSSTSSP